MTDCFEPTIFIRHHRMLRALMLESQAWFSVQDLARLMGKQLDERATLKLDPDQRRNAWLLSNGQWNKSQLISESGVFAMLVYYYVPENRALRHWLTHHVLPVLHDHPQAHLPNLSQLKWPGTSLSLLHWQSEPWIKLRDMPDVLSQAQGPRTSSSDSWWRKILGALRQR